MSWLVTGLVLAFAAAGTPVFALIGALSLWLFHASGTDVSAVIIALNRLADMPSLIAVPLFTFAGYVLAESKAPQRLVALAETLFGWMPGGVAIAGLCACAMFTAFTGASGVTIIALGGLIYPLLRKQQYPDGFSLGLVTTTGSLGLLFPPSLPIILYALVDSKHISVDKLFAAASGPGIVLIMILSAYAIMVGVKNNVPRIPFSFAALKKAAREAIWEIPLPFVIIGGIYTGQFTASEAAAVMSFYVLIAEVLIYKDLKFSDLAGVMSRSMILVGAILIVLGTALGLTDYMIDAEIPNRLFDFLKLHISSAWGFLALLNVVLLVVNMIEIFSAIIIVVPIIVPVALKYQIDPVHLGALFLLNLEIGYMTPPMGLNLFLASRRFERPLPELYKATLPFWLILLGALALVTYIPGLSLWLPNHLHIQ